MGARITCSIGYYIKNRRDAEVKVIGNGDTLYKAGCCLNSSTRDGVGSGGHPAVIIVKWMRPSKTAITKVGCATCSAGSYCLVSLCVSGCKTSVCEQSGFVIVRYRHGKGTCSAITTCISRAEGNGVDTCIESRTACQATNKSWRNGGASIGNRW